MAKKKLTEEPQGWKITTPIMKELIKFAMYCTGWDQGHIELLYSNWIKNNEPKYEEELAKILRVICDINNVEIEDVKGEDRDEDLITARREYCYSAYKLTTKSLKKIGEVINKGHATVLYHKRKIEGWLNIPGYNLKEKLETIERKLK